MEEGGVVTLARPIMSRPKLVVPPRNPSEGFIRGGLNSATPTPMSFGSSLFAEQDPYAALSPLLADALGSPAFKPTSFFSNLVNKMSFTDLLTSSNGDEKQETIESDRIGEAPVDPQQLNLGARYKARMPLRLPISSSSAHLTIPPGISPAALLESPILFRMAQADPSPTTGSFSMLLDAQERGSQNMDDNSASSPGKNDGFMFKPYPLVEKCGSPVNIGTGTLGMHFEENAKHTDEQLQPHIKTELSCGTGIPASDSTLRLASSISSGVLEPQDHRETSIASLVNRPPQKGPTSYVSGVAHYQSARLSIDGYNWKKYGQKQLKNCENPRSYYKCTHPNCLAKRQVERSLEGEITQIMYKGEHNHAKPEGSRRGARNGTSMAHNSEGAHQDHVFQDSSAIEKMDYGKASGDVSSLSFVLPHGGVPGTPELSFTSPSNEEDENGEASIVEDNGEDEHDSKRRRIESEENYAREPIRTTREPRVVVQTVSEVDILDDGYRWRKYGQKVVKGQHYPRNYYRCTNVGCTVRKHVERCSTNEKSVITTYEGKHNHGVPVAKGGS